MEALFSTAAAAWQKSQGPARRPRRAQDRLRQLLPLIGQRCGRLVGGAGTILPGCRRKSGWCSLVELISFADEPPTGLVRLGTKPRCTLQAYNVAIEVAQRFEKIVVKSVFGEVWFRRE